MNAHHLIKELNRHLNNAEVAVGHHSFKEAEACIKTAQDLCLTLSGCNLGPKAAGIERPRPVPYPEKPIDLSAPPFIEEMRLQFLSNRLLRIELDQGKAYNDLKERIQYLRNENANLKLDVGKLTVFFDKMCMAFLEEEEEEEVKQDGKH